MGARIGVCSWSLRPATPGELALRVRAARLACVQLALDPLRGSWSFAETTDTLAEAGIEVRSGMMGMKGEDYSTLATIRETGGVRPDEHWEENRRAASDNARLARELGLELVSFHAGFLPEDDRGGERAKLLERLAEIVARFAEHGVRCAFETGQEKAIGLRRFLEDLDRPGTGVNFDPANMLLYGAGEPVAALEELAPWVRQVHVKDARRSRTPGSWGEEVPVGAGEVDWDRFFDVLRARELDVDFMIEREAGGERLPDILRARDLVREKLAARDLWR